MAAKRNKYDDYENENKGKMWKVFKPLLIALAIALGVCLLSLALADAGFFPGNLLNRFVVSSFLDEKYGGEIVSYDRYDSASGNFIYKCTESPAKSEQRTLKYGMTVIIMPTAATSLLKPSQKIIWIII